LSTLGLGLVATLPEPLNGKLLCIDIQEKAIERLFCKKSGLIFLAPSGFISNLMKRLQLKVDTMLHGIKNALEVLCSGGMLSITCHPGHPEGKKVAFKRFDRLSKKG